MQDRQCVCIIFHHNPCVFATKYPLPLLPSLLFFPLLIALFLSPPTPPLPPWFCSPSRRPVGGHEGTVGWRDDGHFSHQRTPTPCQGIPIQCRIPGWFPLHYCRFTYAPRRHSH